MPSLQLCKVSTCVYTKKECSCVRVARQQVVLLLALSYLNWYCSVPLHERKRQTDRLNPAPRKDPGGPGLGCEAEIENRPTYPEGGGQAGPGGGEAL